MVLKIIVASIIGLLSFMCLMFSFKQIIKEGNTDKLRAFYGIMIAMSASITTIVVVWLAFII